MALAATTLSATAAVPATAPGSSPQAAVCEDEHSGHAAEARVRKGSKKFEPLMFEGTGDQYDALTDAATLAAGDVTVPTYFHVMLPAAEATNGTAVEDRLEGLVLKQVAVLNEAFAGRTKRGQPSAATASGMSSRTSTSPTTTPGPR